MYRSWRRFFVDRPPWKVKLVQMTQIRDGNDLCDLCDTVSCSLRRVEDSEWEGKRQTCRNELIYSKQIITLQVEWYKNEA